MNDTSPVTSSAFSDNVKIIYGLYLAGIFIQFLPLIGLIWAYVAQDSGTEVEKSHYRFQIRTFWIALLFGVVSAILTAVLIGFLGFVLLLVWYIIRCVKGLQAAIKGEGLSNPTTWLW